MLPEGWRKEEEKCVRNNVGYEGKCARCPTKYAYVGESSRMAYITEHLSNYGSSARLHALPPEEARSEFGKQKRGVKSWMWEHSRDCHGGVIGDRR